MSHLILSCAKTGRAFKSGFPASRDDLDFMPPELTARFHCGPCGKIHEFEFAAARVCECPHECPHNGAPFGSLVRQTPANARSGEGKSWAKLRHHEAAQALWLAVAGVTAIMLIANLLLLILY